MDQIVYMFILKWMDVSIVGSPTMEKGAGLVRVDFTCNLTRIVACIAECV